MVSGRANLPAQGRYRGRREPDLEPDWLRLIGEKVDTARAARRKSGSAQESTSTKSELLAIGQAAYDRAVRSLFPRPWA